MILFGVGGWGGAQVMSCEVSTGYKIYSIVYTIYCIDTYCKYVAYVCLLSSICSVISGWEFFEFPPQ